MYCKNCKKIMNGYMIHETEIGKFCPVCDEELQHPEAGKIYEYEYENKSKFSQVFNSLDLFLSEKNKRYGNSALEPMEIFTGKTKPLGIGVRIDDKLSRIKNSQELRKNDVVDLMGYLVLLCIGNAWTDFKELID